MKKDSVIPGLKRLFTVKRLNIYLSYPTDCCSYSWYMWGWCWKEVKDIDTRIVTDSVGSIVCFIQYLWLLSVQYLAFYLHPFPHFLVSGCFLSLPLFAFPVLTDICLCHFLRSRFLSASSCYLYLTVYLPLADICLRLLSALGFYLPLADICHWLISVSGWYLSLADICLCLISVSRSPSSQIADGAPKMLRASVL